MMKKIFIFLSFVYISDAHAFYTQDIQNGCGLALNNNLQAIYEVNKYTCNSGEFLPADTLGCEPCPADYICNGGTYAYNPIQSQGAIRTNSLRNDDEDYTCASNFPHKLHAIFERNIL